MKICDICCTHNMVNIHKHTSFCHQQFDRSHKLCTVSQGQRSGSEVRVRGQGQRSEVRVRGQGQRSEFRGHLPKQTESKKAHTPNNHMKSFVAKRVKYIFAILRKSGFHGVLLQRNIGENKLVISTLKYILLVLLYTLLNLISPFA